MNRVVASAKALVEGSPRSEWFLAVEPVGMVAVPISLFQELVRALEEAKVI